MISGQQDQDEEAIFCRALAIESQSERVAYLRAACGANQGLLERVRALVAASGVRDDFLDDPEASAGVFVEVPALVESSGTVVGRYRLLEKIGEGGMAVVYMAEQEEPIRRKVALKIIKLGMDTRQVIARFEAERQALALMDHPNIAKVHDAGATETGRPYFVMELVHGVSITEYCDGNSLGTKDRLGLFIQVCNAVQHAHQKGIIHRDIKPSNVLVAHHDGKPVPKVIDFGIAKATNQRLTEKTLFTRYAHIIGTPAYMSPEQAELSDVDIDTRSDIYSLGVLLYELLTGTPPFSEEQLRKAGYLEMQRVIREQEPVKPSTRLTALGDTLTDIARRRSSSPELLRRTVRGDLDWIVMKALEKDRTRRYDSTAHLVEDVRRHLDHEPVSAGPPGAWYQTRKFLQRHGRLAAIVAGGLSIVLTGFMTSTVLYLRAERARREMDVARAEAVTVADFLTKDLLASVYPERTKGAEVTVAYLLDNASEGLERKFADSPLAEAKVRDALGLAYQKMGKYEEAEVHLKRALALRQRLLGPECSTTLTSLDRLGWLCWCQGRMDEGRALVTKALETRQRVLGPEHPDTIESTVTLSWLTKDYREALVLAERAHEMAHRTLEEDHPVALAAATSLAYRCVERSRLKQARGIAPRAYEVAQRVLGEEHETTLCLMNVLAWLDERMGRHEAGAALAERSLEIAQRVVGEKHILTLHAMANAGSLYVHLGRQQEAEELLLRSRELASQYLGEDHMIAVCCGLKLGVLYREQGRFDEHDTLFFELLETCRHAYGEGAVLTGFARYGLVVREKQLAELVEQQRAQSDDEKAAATQTRLDEIRRALARNSGQAAEADGAP